jgi:prepilin-type N-terminal cleavage/methylation domain-containing protein
MRELREREAGFSLIEIMTVIGVVGIILAIAAPTIQNQIAIQEIRGAGRQVVEVLRGARDSALNEGVPRYVLFDPAASPKTYQVYRYSGGAWVAEEPPAPLPDTVTFSTADVTFPQLADVPETGATVPEDAAYFDTRGRYPFQQGAPSAYTVTLTGGAGRVVTLTVHRSTGQVTGV